MNYKSGTAIRLKYDVPEDAVLGWHFLNEYRRLRYGDNREVVVGESLTVKGVPEVASWGLHVCTHLDTAYRMRPNDSAFVCFVWIDGTIDKQINGVMCGQRRNCIAMLECDTFLALWWEYEDNINTLQNQMYAGIITLYEHNRQHVILLNGFETDVLKAMEVIEEE